MHDLRETDLAWEQRAAATTKRKVLMVVGMHRSGTSATAGVLSLLGATLPRELMPAAPGNNDLGFFEPSRIVAIHDELLALAGSSWDDTSPLREEWFRSSMARGFVHRLTVAFCEDYGKARLPVLKDPRLCRLLPLWREVLKSLEMEPLFVMPFRHPSEVAASLARRDGFSSQKSQMLWLQHLLLAEHATRGDTRSFVSYDELLTDPSGTLARLAVDLGVRWPRSLGEANADIKEFLTRRHQHNRVFSREGLSLGTLSPLASQTYAILERVADRPGELDEAAFDQLRDSYLAADRSHGALVRSLEDAVAAARVELESQRNLANSEAALLAGRIDSLLREIADRESRMADLTAQTTLRQEQMVALQDHLQQSQARLNEQIAGREEAVSALRHEADARVLAMEAQLQEVRNTHLAVMAARDAALEANKDVVAAQGAQIHRLSAQLDELGTESAFLREEARRAQDERLGVRTEMLVLHRQVAARDQALSERDERIGRMRLEAETLLERSQRMEERWREAASAVDQIRASTSWRLTEPVRKVKTGIASLARWSRGN